jgi:hypothetical protein
MNAGELPLGFKQRLALACALMHQPPLAVSGRAHLGGGPGQPPRILEPYQQPGGQGRHGDGDHPFMDEAEYCDRIGLVYRGRMIASGTPDELKAMVAVPICPIPAWKTPSSRWCSVTTVAGGHMSLSLRRLAALCRKESYQIVRDPSSILIAFVLPVLLLFIYGYGINLDANRVRLGIVQQDGGVEASRLVQTLQASPYIAASLSTSESAMRQQLQAGSVRGVVIVRSDFSARVRQGRAPPPSSC